MQSSSSRTSLFLMELIIAILFFSLAGAVCIQLFVRAHIISGKSVELNYSVLWAQNTAELFYGCNGDTEQMAALLENSEVSDHGNGQTLTLLFDQDFHTLKSDPNIKDSADSALYRLKADISKASELMTFNIIVENLESSKEPQTVYTLELSLFPDKEASHEQ